MQWKKAVADGTVNKPADTSNVGYTSDAPAVGEALSIGQLMAFSGPAPGESQAAARA